MWQRSSAAVRWLWVTLPVLFTAAEEAWVANALSILGPVFFAAKPGQATTIFTTLDEKAEGTVSYAKWVEGVQKLSTDTKVKVCRCTRLLRDQRHAHLPSSALM